MKSISALTYLFFWGVFLGTVLLKSRASAEAISPEMAARRVGETIEMKGTVFSVAFSKGKAGTRTGYLSFGNAYPRQVFTVQIRPDQVPGSEGLPSFSGRDVRVRGLVEASDSGPRIKVSTVDQIEVLPVDESSVIRAAADSAAARDKYAAAWSQILLKDGFDVIETEATVLLATKARFDCGVWKLTYFMKGLSMPQGSSPIQWERHFEALDQWEKAYPGSPVQRAAKASLLVSYAWNARGTDYAHSVSEEGWALFKERLESAREIFDSLSRKDWSPYTYARWITLAMGLGLPAVEVDGVFNEGAGRWPDYAELYATEARRRLPRWYGAPGEWERWLNDRTQPETDLTDEIYARTAWAQSTAYEPLKENIFKEGNANWERVQRGFEAMRRKYPHSWLNLNAYAKMAGLANDRPKAAALMKEITGHEDMGYWVSWENYGYFEDWVEDTDP